MKHRILAFLLIVASSLFAEPLVKSGDTIAFLGDSITQQGAATAGGYVQSVITGLKSAGIEATAIPAGIGGNKSDQMLARLERDVLSQHPVWMTLSCGVNDVWHGDKGIPLDAYQANITAIVDRARAAGVRVVILTATPIMEDLDNDFNRRLEPYNAFLRRLASERGLPLADLNAEFRAALAALPPPAKPGAPRLTSDGVHPNPRGHDVLALGVLRALGLDESQLAAARAKLENTPWSATIHAKTGLTLTDYNRLDALARAQGQTLEDYLNRKLREQVSGLLKDAPAAP